MGRAIVALCVSIGGIALGIWVDRLNAPMWMLALAWIGPFAVAAVIAWWPRWKAAWKVFWSPDHEPPAVSVEPDLSKWQSDRNETISRKIFRNEKIGIDGKTFDHCQFFDVTLFFRGVATYTLLECQFHGKTFVKSDNIAAMAFMELVERLRAMPNTTVYMVGIEDKNTGEIRVTSKMVRQQEPPMNRFTPPRTRRKRRK